MTPRGFEYGGEARAAGAFCVHVGLGPKFEQTPAKPPPDAYLLIEARRGAPRVFRVSDGGSLYVDLPGALVARVAAAIGRRANDLAPRLLATDEIVAGLSLLLLEDAEAGRKRGWVYTESLSAALVVHLFATYGKKPGKLGWAARLPGGLLHRVTGYVEAHLEEELSIRKLAALVGLSPSHFSALFRRATGLSPHRFLIERRVERARDLLVSSVESISEVAVRVGFCDQSHLTKQMRRVLGISPGSLRRMGRHFS